MAFPAPEPEWQGQRGLELGRAFDSGLRRFKHLRYGAGEAPTRGLALFSESLIYLLIYLFLASLGLRCCTRAFSRCGERGLLFVSVRGLLIVVASLVAEYGL